MIVYLLSVLRFFLCRTRVLCSLCAPELYTACEADDGRQGGRLAARLKACGRWRQKAESKKTKGICTNCAYCLGDANAEA